jgi:hypothetical protein
MPQIGLKIKGLGGLVLSNSRFFQKIAPQTFVGTLE